jgi:glycosyltransferase involved in cell wall biosynthesis
MRSGEPSSSPVALVHDYLLVMRGAERTFAAIADCWPNAPIYTLLYDEEGTEGRFAGREVHTSHLQRLGVGQRGFRALLPLFPYAARGLALDGHSLVVSSSSAFAHGVRAPAGARHACYCHSPFRYAWFEQERALSEVPTPARPLLRGVLANTRRADLRAAGNVSTYIANSAITRERIRSYWGRSASVVHPPVEVERFGPATGAGEHFLVVGELVRHKRVEVALEAARLARVPIRVVGEGPDRERLEAEFGGAAEFLGRVQDDELAELYAHARALVMPNVEEFGISAVEAQAAGRPVVAVAAGGALETILHGKTGVLVQEGGAAGLAAALRDTDFDRFEPRSIAAHAQRFSTAAFQRRLREEVEGARERPAASPETAQAPVPPASTLS